MKMNGELLNLIDCTVKKAVEQSVCELKKQHLLIEGRQTPFQKTETLLFNYNNFVSAINEKEEQIKELKEYGLKRKSNSVTSFTSGSGFLDVKSEQEKIDERIESIESSMHVTKTFVRILDDALSALKDDPYYELIPMRYFKGCSRTDIADHFLCDERTVTRNKNRLINQLQIRLFSDQVIQQIFAF
jgi:DNA-directed RNA polymerase specialized sigma subunit